MFPGVNLVCSENNGVIVQIDQHVGCMYELRFLRLRVCAAVGLKSRVPSSLYLFLGFTFDAALVSAWNTFIDLQAEGTLRLFPEAAGIANGRERRSFLDGFNSVILLMNPMMLLYVVCLKASYQIFMFVAESAVPLKAGLFP